MSAPESSGSAANHPGLFSSLRSFWSVLVAILYTRLDLVTAELEDEAIRGLKFIATALIGLLSLHMAFLFAMFFLLALIWDTEYRIWVIGGIFLLYALAGLLCFFIARHMIVSRPKFLSQTLTELRKDVEGLRRAAVVKKDEIAP